MTAATVVEAMGTGTQAPTAGTEGGSRMAPLPPYLAGQRGGIATREGWAKRYRERTGKNWYAAIQTGRPRRQRYSPKGEGQGSPSGVAHRGGNRR